MHVQPYLFLEGRCDEAIAFYKKTLGAEDVMLMRWKDSPDPAMAGSATPDAVMHARFKLGKTEVFASDGRCSGTPGFQGFALSIEVDDESDADRKFDALADGGQVQMPLGKTFFARKFGMVTDRFGVAWMIYLP
jgi:PhnB protein